MDFGGCCGCVGSFEWSLVKFDVVVVVKFDEMDFVLIFEFVLKVEVSFVDVCESVCNKGYIVGWIEVFW